MGKNIPLQRYYLNLMKLKPTCVFLPQLLWRHTRACSHDRQSVVSLDCGRLLQTESTLWSSWLYLHSSRPTFWPFLVLRHSICRSRHHPSPPWHICLKYTQTKANIYSICTIIKYPQVSMIQPLHCRCKKGWLFVQLWSVTQPKNWQNVKIRALFCSSKVITNRIIHQTACHLEWP